MTRKDSLWLMAASLVSVLTFWYFCRTDYTIIDTWTYLSDKIELFSRGNPGFFRPPGYPAFIRLCEVLPGWYYTNIMYLQIAVFVASVAVFRFAASLLGPSRTAANICTLLYGCLPYITVYTMVVEAEVFCISAIVALVYCCARYQATQATGWIWMSCATAFWLILLKPVYIVMIAILPLYWALVLWNTERKRVIIPLIFAFVSVASVLGYRQWVRNSYGISSMSFVAMVNNWYLLNDNGLASPIDIDDPGDRLLAFDSDGNLRWVFDVPPTVIERVEARCISRHKTEIVGAILRRTIDFACYPAIFNTENGYSPVTFTPDKDPFRLFILYIILAVYAALWCWPHTRRRLLARGPAQLILPLIALALMTTSIAGAMDDWGRLNTPAFSCYLLLGAIIISSLKKSDPC